MNIHLPAILGFTRYQGFDPYPYEKWIKVDKSVVMCGLCGVTCVTPQLMASTGINIIKGVRCFGTYPPIFPIDESTWKKSEKHGVAYFRKIRARQSPENTRIFKHDQSYR
jgi:hypothetical protein